jgi:predicted aminopeptidase
VAAYYELVPAFELLLRRHNHDLEQFYGAVDGLMRLSRKDRHRWMLGLVETGTEAGARALKLED